MQHTRQTTVLFSLDSSWQSDVYSWPKWYKTKHSFMQSTHQTCFVSGLFIVALNLQHIMLSLTFAFLYLTLKNGCGQTAHILASVSRYRGFETRLGNWISCPRLCADTLSPKIQLTGWHTSDSTSAALLRSIPKQSANYPPLFDKSAEGSVAVNWMEMGLWFSIVRPTTNLTSLQV
jgi:hypothetical protein